MNVVNITSGEKMTASEINLSDILDSDLTLTESLLNQSNGILNLEVIDEVESLLISWGFSTTIINKFKEYKLTLWHLQVIDDFDIKVLFPDNELADRIKFKACVKNWRNPNKGIEEFTTSASASPDTLSLASGNETDTSERSGYTETYYIPRTKGGVPKGKLYDRFRNTKQQLRKKGLITTNTKQKRDKGDTTGTDTPSTVVSTSSTSENLEVELQDLKSWLKYNQEDNCWDEVCNKWRKTTLYRKHDLSQSSITEFIEQWPLIKHSKAPLLIPEIKLLNIFHYVFKPSAKILKKDKKLWKPSIADSQYAQFLQLATVSDLIHKVEQRRSMYQSVGLKVQPFVILVGADTKEEFYMIPNSNAPLWCNDRFDKIIRALSEQNLILRELALKDYGHPRFHQKMRLHIFGFIMWQENYAPGPEQNHFRLQNLKIRKAAYDTYWEATGNNTKTIRNIYKRMLEIVKKEGLGKRRRQL
ncbi:hypothetical protein FQR65_LT15932 [Abscondita terminalis]|nr:hypothetical protein FQR65_LT15932 [Abscondita terminalis]